MRVVLQRVKESKVEVDGRMVGRIDRGLLVLLGIEHEDTEDDAEWLVNKILNMRIFADDEGKMNRSLLDIEGQMLVVSQFTLHAKTKKGNRPSFIDAARPERANPLYEHFLKLSSAELKAGVASGEFGAMMDVSLVNDGPVTIVMDSKNKE